MRFELPTSFTPSVLSEKVMKALPSDLSKGITDAGHTVVGFATMATKRLNDNRLDVNAKYEAQVRELRKGALSAVKAVKVVRQRVESTIDPVVDRAVERFPENVQDTVTEFRKVSRQAVAQTERRVVSVIEFATAVPTKAVRRTVKPVVAAKTPAAKTPAAKPAVKKSPVVTSVKSVKSVKVAAIRKPVAAKKSVAKSATKPVATRKPVARPVAVKKIARPVAAAKKTVKKAA